MLTKKIIILKANEESSVRYNYNYEVMKMIYEAMTIQDANKALNIHDNGYKVGEKKFKLFNFHLEFDEKVKYEKAHIALDKNSSLKLIISGINEVVNLILKGLVKQQGIMLNETFYKLVDVKNDKTIRFNNITLFKVRTAVVESVQDSNRRQVYTNVYQEEFYSSLAGNLKRKYKAVYKKDYEGELYFDIENLLNVKRKYIEIKPKSAVEGYSNFEIFIQADKDMQKIIYFLGLGQGNSLGFGSVSFISSRELS